MWFQGEFKGLRTRRADDVNSSLKACILKSQEESVFQIESEAQQRSIISQHKQSGRRRFLLLSLFFSIQVFNWLDEFHPHLGRQSALLGILIQMLILSRNTFTDILRIMFDQCLGTLCPREVNFWNISISVILKSCMINSKYRLCGWLFF